MPCLSDSTGGQDSGTDRIIHVRVYRLLFDAEPELSSTAGPAELAALFGGVNRLWRGCGISWRVQSVREMRIREGGSRGFAAVRSRGELRQHLLALSPEVPGVVGWRLWRVCLMRAFPIKAGGVYLPEAGTVYCTERVPNGDPNAAVLAHELGHSLGLQHVTASGNLMNPNDLKSIHRLLREKPAGVTEDRHFLVETQVGAARCQAALGPFQARSKVDPMAKTNFP